MRQALSMLGSVVFSLTACSPGYGADMPTVFKVSDPVLPDETVMAHGAGLGAVERIEIARISDRSRELIMPRRLRQAEVLQASDVCLKFVVPKSLKPGLFVFRIVGAGGTSKVGILNRPQCWWSQGNLGTDGSPGGYVRVFGKCFSLGDDRKMRVRLSGPRAVTLQATGDCWNARAALPGDLPSGVYALSIHNGDGGKAGWSDPVDFRVRVPDAWPDKVFDVKRFGADGTGRHDDTEALKAALIAAGENGGGVVFLPRGRYQVREGLDIPRFTVLRGEKTEWVSLFWPNTPSPPEALIHGSNSFGVEDLTVYCTNYRHGIVGDLGDKPDAGSVRLRRVRMRLVRYRGHITLDEEFALTKAARRYFGGDTVRMGGADIEISDCDFYGSGRALFLSRTRGGRVTGNNFYNGRHGWYCISGSNGLIFENNHITGADLMATGGGLNCLDGSTFSQNIYYAGNVLRLMHGWDREAMTSDAGGGAYYGRASMSNPGTLVLTDSPEWGGRDWRGAGVYIVGGKGRGQYRRVADYSGQTVKIDRPWTIAPDAASLFSVTMRQEHYIVANNEFSDAGIAVQFYGISIEHVIAGNKAIRAGGFQNIGKLYAGSYRRPPEKNFGHQPSWYCQFIGNEILEGNVYRGGANNSIVSGPSVLAAWGWPPKKGWPWPYNAGTVMRRNRLRNNAVIRVGGTQDESPSVRDVLIEGNGIAHADNAFDIDRGVQGVVLRHNRLDHVDTPFAGPGMAHALVTSGQLAEAVKARLRGLVRRAGLRMDPMKWPEIRAAVDKIAEVPNNSPDRAGLERTAVDATVKELAKQGESVPFNVLGSTLGLSLAADSRSTLPELLQTGSGGSGTLTIALKAQYDLPWMVRSEITVPHDWRTSQTEAVPLRKGILRFTHQITLPTETFGRVTLPVCIVLEKEKTTLRLDHRLELGSGFLHQWLLIGPFPNDTKSPLDRTIHPPEDGIDLDATCKGVNGQVRWQAFHGKGHWLDLAKHFKTTRPGVAFVLACVEAHRETSACLRIGSSAGVALLLDGALVWSQSSERKPRLDQDCVPVTLRRGDNALLFKVCSVGKDWRFAAELAPLAGHSLTGIRVIGPEEFKDRPIFGKLRPQTSAKGQDKPMVCPAGIDWKPVFVDSFTRDILDTRWRAALGAWTVGNGQVISADGKSFLGYAKRIPAPVRIEYEARVSGLKGSDLSAFWLADPANYHTGILLGFGSNGNTVNKLLENGEQTATAQSPLATPGKWHRVIAQVLASGRVQLIIDGQMSLNFQGKSPGPPKFPGVWTWGAGGAFRNLRVYTGQ